MRFLFLLNKMQYSWSWEKDNQQNERIFTIERFFNHQTASLTRKRVWHHEYWLRLRINAYVNKRPREVISIYVKKFYIYTIWTYSIFKLTRRYKMRWKWIWHFLNLKDVWKFLIFRDELMVKQKLSIELFW